ncbi:MAG: alpha/beta fold hydrolase [Bacteroidota bacterium]
MHLQKIEGNGKESVLFLHGFLESGSVWSSWLNQESWDEDLFIPDLPGHGNSPEWEEDKGFADWGQFLINKIDELKDPGKKIHIIGHSMGGYMAMEMALLFPSRIGKLVLLHSTPFPDTPVQIQRRKKQIELIEKGRKSLLIKNVGLAMLAPANRDRLLISGRKLNREAANCSASGMVKALNAIMNRSGYRNVVKAKMRDILLVTGDQDPFMPPDYYKTVISHFPEISHHCFPDCGHASFIEKPEASLRIVKAFINSPIYKHH